MKSLHTKLSEALEKMTSKQRDKFYESRKSSDPIEVQVNCAEAILAGKVKEAAHTITKHNGAGDNGGEVFTESGNSETSQAKKFVERSNAILRKGLGLSEADCRRLDGLPPVDANLTPTQLREYRWCRTCNISEADSLRLARKVA